MSTQSRTSRRWAVAAIAGAAIALAACGRTSRPPIKVLAQVPVIAAASGTVYPVNTLGGLVAPFQNVMVQTTVTEPTAGVYVEEGDHVSKGQLLAQLDTADLRANLAADLSIAASDKAKAQQTFLQAGLTISQNSNSVNAAQSALTQTQATLAKDTVDLQRDTQLLASGYLSQQAFDQEKTLVANDREAVRSAQVALQNQKTQVQTNGTTSSGMQGAAVASTRADMQTALANADMVRAQIAKARIVSPIDGIVVNRNLNPGEYPGTRQIFTLQETDKVYAMLNGSGGQIVGVRTGSPAVITSTDRATLQGNGRVAAVLDEVTPGSTNFTVRVLLPNPRGVFHAGMVVSGRVSQPPSTGIRIPDTAFLDDTHSSVQIVNTGGLVQTIPVTQVAQDSKNAVVQGLQRGQHVIVNGQLGLADGQAVKPLLGGSRTVAER